VVDGTARHLDGLDPRDHRLLPDTTRGDRLFIGLLGSAFILMGWIFLVGTVLWWPLAICAAWIVLVFLLV
jgi:predicted small integral membrane protein